MDKVHFEKTGYSVKAGCDFPKVEDYGCDDFCSKNRKVEVLFTNKRLSVKVTEENNSWEKSIQFPFNIQKQ